MVATRDVTHVHSDGMKAEVLLPIGVFGGLGAATSAIDVGDRLWVGSTKSDRVGNFDLDR